ncbi:MAG: hypothetical protein FGM14_03665 [Flavobacteriales bacterium]|nr:hypothetical protein [Flavobacteriales bacterium]
MENSLLYSSNKLFLFLNGKIEDILTPWIINIDFQKEIITIKKKNWYLIGVNEYIHAFRLIKRIEIKQHIFGADIEIRSMGNTSKICCIKKINAEEIKLALIDYNQGNKGGFIIC